MNRLLTMDAEGLQTRRFTTADVDRMTAAGILDVDERYELLDGEIVPMSPQHLPHARKFGDLYYSLRTRMDRARFEVFAGATVELSNLTRVDPDICVARAGASSKILPASAVHWVIEVSDASRWKDLKMKAPLCAAAGIPEYWVVDLDERVTHIHRGPSASGWSEPVLRAPFVQPVAPAQFPDLELILASL